MAVKEQFNKQAKHFSNWPVTQDENILRSLYTFFGIEAAEQVLDFGCGTGAFAIYAAQHAETVLGLDISERMIDIAVESARRRNLKNINFLCCNVEKVPLENNSFDCVISKSAFHHMKNYKAVFEEMVRCCAIWGRVCIEDIIAYGDQNLDDYFEELECEIDVSHNLSLPKLEIVNLYKQNGVEIIRLFESISELNFAEYVGHAVQTGKAREKIDRLLGRGLEDQQISEWFLVRNNDVFWKRKVLTVVGKKGTTKLSKELKSSQVRSGAGRGAQLARAPE